MIKIGITGQNGFIGQHLYNTLGLLPQEFERIACKNLNFNDPKILDEFVRQCDVIVHLAAINRHKDPQLLYDTNISLVSKLIEALERTDSHPHVIMSSSSHEERDNMYGKSKKEGRNLFVKWTNRSSGTFTGMIIPNVYGPFGAPNYNSVVATFSHKIAHGQTPKIEVDAKLKLIYIGELVNDIIKKSKERINEPIYKGQHTAEVKVSELLRMLKKFNLEYKVKGEIPAISNNFELNLFNTFRCYIDHKNHFPIKFKKHTDIRGSFIELIRLGVGGQLSFSTTVPGVTRGNHFHTRKIERFAVIKGKALIQLRRIGTEEVIDFYLDGEEPAYVDMPIWYTHNIKNIGKEVLYTNFWINESYDPKDSDTFFEKVQF